MTNRLIDIKRPHFFCSAEEQMVCFFGVTVWPDKDLPGDIAVAEWTDNATKRVTRERHEVLPITDNVFIVLTGDADMGGELPRVGRLELNPIAAGVLVLFESTFQSRWLMRAEDTPEGIDLRVDLFQHENLLVRILPDPHGGLIAAFDPEGRRVKAM